jgi:hypothetical protein
MSACLSTGDVGTPRRGDLQRTEADNSKRCPMSMRQDRILDMSGHHRINTSSALTPGPSPIIRPADPADGGPAPMVFSMMYGTDAEDRLPASASERRLSSLALSGSLRLFWMAWITFGPPGWQTPGADLLDGQIMLGQEEGDGAAQPPPDYAGQSCRQDDAEAVRAQPPSRRVAAVGVHLEGEELDGPIETMASRAAGHGTFKLPAGRVHDVPALNVRRKTAS